MSMQEAFQEAITRKAKGDKQPASVEDQLVSIGEDWHTARVVSLDQEPIKLLRKRWVFAQVQLNGIAHSERHLLLVAFGRGLHVWDNEDPNFAGVRVIKGRISDFLPGRALSIFPRGHLTTGSQVYTAAVVDLSYSQRQDFTTLYSEIFTQGGSASTIRLEHVVPAVDRWLFAA